MKEFKNRLAAFAGTVRRIVRCFCGRPCDRWPGGKPCPECGQHPHLRPWHDPVAIANGGTDTTRYRVECPSCGHVGPNKSRTPEQAITEWNRAANAANEPRSEAE